jgi:AraC-like DNA-binding protein
MAPTKRKPLDQFPVIRTADVDEMRAATSRFYGDLTLSIVGDFARFYAHGNYCQLSDVGISYASYDASVDQLYLDLYSGYSVPIAVAGSGSGKVAGRTVGVTDQESLIGSPGLPVELHSDPDYEEIAILLDASAVKRKLAALIGAEVEGDLVFDPLFDFTNSASALWRRHLRFLISELEFHQGDLPRTALAEIEQALIITFLKVNRHNFSHLLDGRRRAAAPRQVRLAEEYIEAHWNEPITIESLVMLTGVSSRSLFHSFKTSRGYSPMAFVKKVRLRHARQMLISPEPYTTVAKVAYQCAFSNLSDFAKDYRKAFRELPSDTLRMGPGPASH